MSNDNTSTEIICEWKHGYTSEVGAPPFVSYISFQLRGVPECDWHLYEDQIIAAAAADLPADVATIVAKRGVYMSSIVDGVCVVWD